MQQKKRFGTYWVSDYSGKISGPKIADIMESKCDTYNSKKGKKMTKKFSRLVASLESEEIEDMVLAKVEPVHLEDYKSGKLKYSWQRR